MLIRCPACEHSRTVNSEQIPPRAEFATCPKCGHRFRFRALDPETAPPPPAPDVRHKDIWDAVDSLQERWKTPEDDRARQKEDQAAQQSPAESDSPDSPAPSDHPLRQAGSFEEPQPFEEIRQAAQGIPTPWENRNGLSLISSLYYTVLLALTKPSRFYAGIRPNHPLTPALFFFLALSIFFYLASMAWQFLILGLIGQEAASTVASAYGDPGGELFSMTPAVLFILPFLLALQLVFNAWLIHLGMRLLDPGRASFAMAFKISAYAGSAMMLVLVPFLGPLLGQIGYYVHLVLGCRHAFGLRWRETLTALAPLVGLMFLVTFLQMGWG